MVDIELTGWDDTLKGKSIEAITCARETGRWVRFWFDDLVLEVGFSQGKISARSFPLGTDWKCPVPPGTCIKGFGSVIAQTLKSVVIEGDDCQIKLQDGRVIRIYLFARTLAMQILSATGQPIAKWVRPAYPRSPRQTKHRVSVLPDDFPKCEDYPDCGPNYCHCAAKHEREAKEAAQAPPADDPGPDTLPPPEGPQGDSVDGEIGALRVCVEALMGIPEAQRKRAVEYLHDRFVEPKWR